MNRQPGDIAAIVLAAGESIRMGCPKALLEWRGKVLLQHQIDELTQSGCNPVVIVLGHESQKIANSISCRTSDNVRYNKQYRDGRSSSDRVGIDALPSEIDAVIVVNVDQPCRSETVTKLIQTYRNDRTSIVVPRYKGHNGHPALFDRCLLDEMRDVNEKNKGLRAVRRKNLSGTRFLEIADPSIRFDLNTPEEYRKALQDPEP